MRIFRIALIYAMLGAVYPAILHSEEQVKVTKCDPIYKEVHTAVSAEPDKVLLIVEENVLASEDCVCEIIKAAVHASRANDELTKQIMLTALNAAPQKAKVIEICIAAIVAERGGVTQSGKDVVDVRSGKEGKEVQPLYSEKDVKDPLPVMPPGPDDYRIFPPDIRGVYLIQPAAGGVYFGEPEVIREIVEVPGKPPRQVCRPTPPCYSVPQSPSCFCLTAR